MCLFLAKFVLFDLRPSQQFFGDVGMCLPGLNHYYARINVSCSRTKCSDSDEEFRAKVTNKVSKGAKIRNRYNQVSHLTQDTNGKVTNSQLDTTNESQEISPFPASDHKSQVNRRAQRHSKQDPQKKYHLGTVSKIFYWRA